MNCLILERHKDFRLYCGSHLLNFHVCGRTNKRFSCVSFALSRLINADNIPTLIGADNIPTLIGEFSVCLFAVAPEIKTRGMLNAFCSITSLIVFTESAASDHFTHFIRYSPSNMQSGNPARLQAEKCASAHAFS